MHKHYVINGIVEFHPATSQLRDLNHPENVVVLNSPAGRCLLLLIEKAGSIVTQQQFMEHVWEKRGMMVSSNAYYQNICLLRKGLKKSGFLNDPIVTIPRIGLTLASDTQIAIKDMSALPAKKAGAMPEKSALQEAFGPGQRPPLDETDNSPGMHEPVDAPLYAGKYIASVIKRRPRRLMLTFAFFIVAFFMGGGIMGWWIAQGNNFFEKYRFVAAESGCHFFMTTDNQTYGEKDTSLAYGERFKGNCKNYPWIYISRYSTLPRASVIRCDKPMQEANQCISDYFIEDEER